MTVEPVFLKAIPLLRGFTTQELRDLAGMLELVRVEEDTLLIEQGTNRGGFYFILDGQVKVSRTLPGGREIVLARMGKGHVVGFLTMLDGRPRSANVLTTSKSALALLPREQFEALTTAATPMGVRFQRLLAREMIRTLRLANQRFTRAATLPPEEFLSPEHIGGEIL
jgi:CRP/FNR family cyclic AMP-dependent transcriptional regulator